MKNYWVLFISVVFVLSSPLGVYADDHQMQENQTVADAQTEQEKEYTRTLRSVSIKDLVDRNLTTGIYEGAPKVLANPQEYARNFYNTLASNHGDPIPQYAPPPCDSEQPTGYDTEGCNIVSVLFNDVEDVAEKELAKEMVRKGRDVWFKGTFGNQHYPPFFFGPIVYGEEKPMDKSHWLDTRTRGERFKKWGLINDPDCEMGDESTFWLDRCKDPHSSGVVGFRKYFNPNPPEGFNPRSDPYQEGEIAEGKRYLIGHACATCHAAFDPTNPPKDPENPKWEHITGHIGNQYSNNPLVFFGNLPKEFYVHQLINAVRPGAVDTSLAASDFRHNPGTQNNITDFHNRRVFKHQMRHPITGELAEANTRHVLKGGEDSVGEKLALIRVYVNIGMCTEKCWYPNFPTSGSFFGESARQRPFRIKQCAQDCEEWNQADAKMDDLAAYLIAGGPFYLKDAKDVDGKKGTDFIDYAKVPQGKTVYARECARCHSTKVAPDAIRNDKDALEDFYRGHIFGREDDWQLEVGEKFANSNEFQKQYVKDGRPLQFAEKGVFGQDWLGNDELVPYTEIGTNRCRALHNNHHKGHIFEEFASETYREKPAPPAENAMISPLIPVIGGGDAWFGGKEEVGGGNGYLRNVSLLSIWSHAPFLHNNALGKLMRRPDGSIDYTVAGRIAMFEDAMSELLMSDDPDVIPHREPIISRIKHPTKLPIKSAGTPLLPEPAGVVVGHIASNNPHDPVTLKCADFVENKGHQFGVDLTLSEKESLIEFLKTL